MPYYVNFDAGVLAGPRDIEPSGPLSFAGAVGSAITGNISSLGVDAAELRQANQGTRLAREAADQAFKDAGIKHAAPADGYTQSAVDIIVKRQRDAATLRRVDEATPWSWVGSPVRGGAMLLAGLADPLNVASAFVPVVREARVASMLARAGESTAARAATRVGVGAVEGLAGAAIVEAPTFALRTTLQDDYSLTDSLINLAFGTVAGGGLHAVGGAVGDSLAGGNPYTRFAGLDAKQVRQVMDVRAGQPADIAGFTPAMRRAAGLADEAVDTPAAVRVDAAAPETREAALRTAVAQMAEGRMPEVDAVLRTDADAATVAAPEIAPARATVEAQAFAEVEPGAPTIQLGPEPTQREMAAANEGATALAEAIDKVQAADRRTLYASEVRRLRAAAAGVPPSVGRRYELMANMLEQRGATLTPDGRSAVEVSRAAAAQRSPDAAALGSRADAEAATERQAQARTSDATADAAKDLTDAMERLQNLQRNLEAQGVSRESLDRVANLEAFDEEVKRAKAIGEVARIGAICEVA